LVGLSLLNACARSGTQPDVPSGLPEHQLTGRYMLPRPFTSWWP
jgi:hypothetical protein